MRNKSRTCFSSTSQLSDTRIQPLLECCCSQVTTGCTWKPVTHPAYVPHDAPGRRLYQTVWIGTFNLWPFSLVTRFSRPSAGSRITAWFFSLKLNKNAEQEPDSCWHGETSRVWTIGGGLCWGVSVVKDTPPPTTTSSPSIRVEEPWRVAVSNRERLSAADTNHGWPAAQPHSCRTTSAERQLGWPLEDRHRRRRRRGMFLRGRAGGEEEEEQWRQTLCDRKIHRRQLKKKRRALSCCFF